MKWNETIASQCRYSECAEKIWGKWDILWEDSQEDYQGHASFLAKKGNKYCFYEWWYGSCSGCDTWEDAGLTDKQIIEEMTNTSLFFNGKKELKKWLDMLSGNPISNHGDGGIAGNLDILSGGIKDRINAIRKEFGMKELQLTEGEN